MGHTVTIVLEGIYVGSEWALIAVAFGIITRIAHVFHLAIGGMFGLASYLFYWMHHTHEFPGIMALVIATSVCALVGVLIDTLVYQPIVRRTTGAGPTDVAPFVASLGALIVLGNLVQLKFGASPLGGHRPDWGVIQIGDGGQQTWDIFKVVVSLTAVSLFALWLTRTRTGRSAVALGESPEGARVVGISERKVRMALFFLTGVLAGIGGSAAVLSHPVLPGQGLIIVLYGSMVTLILPDAGVMVWWFVSVLAGILFSAASVTIGSGWAEIILMVSLVVAVLVMRVAIPLAQRSIQQRQALIPIKESV